MNSTVRFGTNFSNLNLSAADATVLTNHEVTLRNLIPNTKYFYSVGNSLNTSRVTDLCLLLGDNAYNTGTDTECQAAVFDMYPAVLRQTVLWSTLGNHETAQLTNYVDTYPYFQMFTMPTNGNAGGIASGTEHYYSFDYANIHFVCLDSMTANRATNGAMANWLRTDMASTTNFWTIAFWHHPAYTKGSHDSDTETPLVEMRQNFLPILEGAGVDLVLSGHSHCYERSFLLNGHYGLSTTLTSNMILNANSGRQTNAAGPYTKWSSGWFVSIVDCGGGKVVICAISINSCESIFVVPTSRNGLFAAR